MLLLIDFVIEVNLKTLSNIFIFIFILLLSSCYNPKLNYKNEVRYPKIKNDSLTPVAVVINTKFKDKNFFLLDNDTAGIVDFSEIRVKIKKEFESKFDRPLVYFYDLDEFAIDNIKKQYDKVVFINMEVGKELNVTLLFDYYSVFLPLPAPEWGNYTFDTVIKITNKNDSKEQVFNYKIVSDFSYMFYPLYRTDEQVTALKKAVNKLVTELLNNDDFTRLFNKDADISFNTSYNYILEEEGIRLVQRDTYSDFPFSVDFRSLFGSSEINGYYKDDSGNYQLGASGRGFVKEFKIQASSYKPTTKFYITPTVGYYYQDIDIKDFGYDTRGSNYGKEGYIPGRVEERDKDGNIIVDSDPYSMNYRSQFSSTYLGGKLGFNMILGDNVRFLFSPLVYFSLLEARHTTITAGNNKFSEWSFPVGGVLGFNFETGLFFSKAHLGFKMGFDMTYFRKFDFGYNIYFNTVVRDENNIDIGKKIEVNRFEIFSKRVFFDVFVVF